MKDLLYSEAAGQPNPKDDGNHNPKGADKWLEKSDQVIDSR
jgi:hypothetical protein